MNADSIKIECEEDGFHLIVETPDDEDGREGMPHRLDFNIHGCAEELHEQVTRIIGSWLTEAKHARLTAEIQPMVEAAFLCNPDESGGYAQDDPKHPRYHSVHADLWDTRAGK